APHDAPPPGAPGEAPATRPSSHDAPRATADSDPANPAGRSRTAGGSGGSGGEEGKR
ncbi:NADH-quinone oxidoreductase subunit NuoE, partial [Streptomyces sp. DJ]